MELAYIIMTENNCKNIYSFEFFETEVTSTHTRPVENVITKGQQDRNINILDGRTVENKN